MAKVYKIGEHSFTQREDGLYICDEPFTMTDDECQDWRLDDCNDGYLMATFYVDDRYSPLAILIPGESSRADFDAYTDSVCEERKCCIMIAHKIPDNFLGGIYFDH